MLVVTLTKVTGTSLFFCKEQGYAVFSCCGTRSLIESTIGDTFVFNGRKTACCCVVAAASLI